MGGHCQIEGQMAGHSFEGKGIDTSRGVGVLRIGRVPVSAHRATQYRWGDYVASEAGREGHYVARMTRYGGPRWAPRVYRSPFVPTVLTVN